MRGTRAAASPDQDGWDPASHIGPIRDSSRAEAAAATRWIVRRRGGIGWLYRRLADDDSRRLLVDLLAHRVMGSRRIAFGPARPTREGVVRFARTALACDTSGLRYDLAPIGLDLSVQATPMFAVHTFLLEQYLHPSIEDANPRSGDCAVDGGAFWGDTALWLAERCGPDGLITAFEMDPANARVLESNLRGNPEMGRRVRVRREALWDETRELALHPAGAGSTVGGGQGVRAHAVAFDDLVDSGELERVDFIKLDVEGAEARVLRGALETIRRFRPRLAVAAYHRWDDLVDLPRLVSAAAPDYRFALTHRSLHQYDTVLFAWPRW